MKKIILMLLFFTLPFPLVYAQADLLPAQGRDGRPQPKERLSHLKEMLKLTDDQSKKIETIFNNDKTQMDALLKKQKEEMEKFRNERDQVSENSDTEILNVLTEEQKTEFKSFLEERKNGMNDMPPFMVPGDGMRRPRGQMMAPPHMGMMPPPMGQGGKFMNGRRMPPPPLDEMSWNPSVRKDRQLNRKPDSTNNRKNEKKTETLAINKSK